MRCSLQKDCAAPTQEKFHQVGGIFQLVKLIINHAFYFFYFPADALPVLDLLNFTVFCCGESFAADAVDQLVSGRCVGVFCGW